MISASDSGSEPRDRTVWVWIAVVTVVAVMAISLWASNRTRRSGESTVRAKHILVSFSPNDLGDRANALDEITTLRRRIEAGESFAKLAREYSDDTSSAARGGDLGYYGKGQFEAAFEEYVWSAPIGELSDIIQTKYGFHLIVVTDRYLSEVDKYEIDLEDKALSEQKASEGGETAPETP
ncbi:MAG: hypothetical protein GWP08_13260 [Nitrospiraceae bacterium]|nr:hypothetical protein [Nitrospiraceae bacterium]